MKSPLKYLAGLMGRGRAAEPPQVLISQDPEPNHLAEAQATLEASVSALALPSETDATPPQSADLPSVVVPIEVEAILDGDAPDPVPAVAETFTPKDDGVAPWPDDAAVALASQTRVKPQTKARAKRISQERTALEIEGAADLTSSDDVHLAPNSTSAPNETVDLDVEITALRKQLAQKLQLQNSQLKKMLERFDRF